MELAFWDSSSLVPICARQIATPRALSLSSEYEMVVWWTTPVEIESAFARLSRMGHLTPPEQVGVRERLGQLRLIWREIQPSRELCDEAEALMERSMLRAADALQLAAAMAWCQKSPLGRAFISGDAQLLEAARQIGFRILEA